MKDAGLMDLYLEAAAPTRDKQRELNGYGIGIGALERWNKLYTEDPDTRRGRLPEAGMAAALWPAGGGGQYRATTSSTGCALPALQDGPPEQGAGAELRPPDGLATTARSSTASAPTRDLAWGRQMIQTWRPDLLEKEQIHKIVSEVWRRFSPIPFTNGFITVMEGGGKCGPRGAVRRVHLPGVRHPGHRRGPAGALLLRRAGGLSRKRSPQLGSVWKVYQGRGWQVSDCGDACTARSSSAR